MRQHPKCVGQNCSMDGLLLRMEKCPLPFFLLYPCGVTCENVWDIDMGYVCDCVFLSEENRLHCVVVLCCVVLCCVT